MFYTTTNTLRALMEAGVKPIPGSPSSTWQWYVAAGSTRDERRARLAECPEGLREAVEGWVRAFFKDQQNARRK